MHNVTYPLLFYCSFVCRNNNNYGNLSVATLALGSRPRQGLAKSVGQEGSPGVTFHAPGSAKECEGMNPHTPKGTPTSFGSWSPNGLSNLHRAIAQVKTHSIEAFSITLKSFWNVDV
jgi:hypothetical protein